MNNTLLGCKLITYLSYTLLLFSGVLNIYVVFGDNYLDVYTGYFLIVLFFLFKVLNVKTTPSEVFLPKELTLFFVYLFIISIITNISPSGNLLSLVTLLILVLRYAVFWNTFRNDLFIKFYILLAVIVVGFFLFQVVVGETTGVNISGVIPGLPLSQTSGENVLIVSNDIRYCSFFSEPSHMAQFLAPLFIFLLFDNSRRIILRKSLIITLLLSLLLLRSGTALVLLMPSLVFFVRIFMKRRINRILKVLLLSLVIVIGVILGVWYLSSSMGAFVSERSAEVYDGMNANEGSSGFLRIWRGYFVYDDFSITEKIFGNDSGNDIIKHVYHSNMELYLDGFALTYFNAIQYILIHSGVIGMLLFLYYLFKLWKNNTDCGKCLIATLFLLMLTESLFGTGIMATFLLMAQSQKNIK